MAAEASSSSRASSTAYEVGRRYLNAKTRRSLTLRYTGPLPPIGDINKNGNTSTSATIWLGVEYDDPAHGKGHSGTYEGIQVFETRQPGAGAFIKFSTAALVRGPTFIEALEERYGPIVPERQRLEGTPGDGHGDEDGKRNATASTSEVEKVMLGGSGIFVEAPGMSSVKSRINKLERLREVGVENEWISALGGDEEQREMMKERLKGVHTLNISGNLLPGWQDVAEIVELLRGLRTLVLNNSRIPSIPDISDNILNHLVNSFSPIEELHLGNSALSWEDVALLSHTFTRVKALHLNDNPIREPFRKKLYFGSLEMLSLSGCQIADWVDLMAGLAQLASLQTLDASRLPFPTIPPRPEADDQAPGQAPESQGITNLILLATSLCKWTDIDSLYSWFGDNLKSLKISISGVEEVESEDVQPHRPVDPVKMSGRAQTDRPVVIAILGGLTSLNSTPITPAERKDAEMWYLSFVSKQSSSAADRSSWGRYDELKVKYGYTDIPSGVRGSGQTATLKSKMMNLLVKVEEDVGVAEHLTAFDISILPSSKLSLLLKKVARRIGKGEETISLMMLNDQGEKIQEVVYVNEASWWFADGDTVVVAAMGCRRR